MVTGSSPTAQTKVAGAPAPSTELVFGRYQIIRRLAVGGMGEVFLARQSGVAGFDRLTILKSLLPDLAAQQDFVDQFLDEARVAATLNHPNIVSIYEVGLWNGTYFIAMEYIRGDNLSRLQRAAEKAKRPIPMDVAAYIVHDTAQALDHAHKATDLAGKPLHIVHRDVSPQNIMVRTDGVTKVVDFGIAKAANRSSRTATGLLKGKVQYMAPEQVQGAELDGRADQFALGVVLWEMLVGRKLFSGNSDLDVLKNVLQAPIPPLASVVPDAHPGLCACVDRMLQRDRNGRYATLADAAQDLKRYLDTVGIKNAQQNAAACMADLLGAEIDSKTVDLTPSSANNFVINLSQTPGTSPTALHAAGRQKARAGIAAGVLVAVVLGGGATAFVLAPQDAPRAVAPVPVTPAALVNPKLAIGTEPPGAIVSVDGVAIGPTPRQLELKPDAKQAITLTLDGYEPISFEKQLKAGEVETFMRNLVKKKAILALASDPSGAEVREGGRLLGKTPLTVELTPDEEHELRLTFESARKRVFGVVALTPKPGATESRTVKLREGRAPPVAVAVAQPVPSGEGTVTINTKPWTKISIDGKPYGSTPIANVKLPAGKHTVTLVNEEAGVNEKRPITVKADEKTKFDWKLQ